VPVEYSPDGASVTFSLTDRGRRLAAVRLVHEIGLEEPADLSRRNGRWYRDLPRPDVDRMEYLFEVEDHNGHRHTVLDPENPLRAAGAFGDKSVALFPDYVPPSWLDVEPVPGEYAAIEVASGRLGEPVAATIWSPAGLPDGAPAPLVVAHDGPEYDRLGGLTRYLGAAMAEGAIPPVRAALVDPGDRNAWYAANDDYAAALCDELLPAVDDAAPASARIGVGVSLGALAMLHAHRRHPGTFDALLLQSGSFFTPSLDPQESSFSGFPAVTGFVAEVESAPADPGRVPTVLTCGTVEENRANNEAMADHLRRLGYPVEFHLVRDAHNYTAWRDALHPHLATLIAKAASDAA
jgi:enterochelin esterase family protein